MMQHQQESQLVVPIPDILYIALKDVLYAYKEWPGEWESSYITTYSYLFVFKPNKLSLVYEAII